MPSNPNNPIGKSVESLTDVGRKGCIESLEKNSGRPIVLWDGNSKGLPTEWKHIKFVGIKRRKSSRDKKTFNSAGIKAHNFKAEDSIEGERMVVCPTFRLLLNDLDAINGLAESEGVARSVFLRRIIKDAIQSRKAEF